MAKTLYRYDSYPVGLNPPRVCIDLQEWYVYRETPMGYWVIPSYGGKERWVSKTGKKRLCYPTTSEALESFKRRKKRQIEILESQLTNAKHAAALARTITTPPDEPVFG
jgi:hypothetical protein